MNSNEYKKFEHLNSRMVIIARDRCNDSYLLVRYEWERMGKPHWLQEKVMEGQASSIFILFTKPAYILPIFLGNINIIENGFQFSFLGRDIFTPLTDLPFTFFIHMTLFARIIAFSSSLSYLPLQRSLVESWKSVCQIMKGYWVCRLMCSTERDCSSDKLKWWAYIERMGAHEESLWPSTV